MIVTHNSQPFISTNVACLMGQIRPPDAVIIVDSLSTDPEYLNHLRDRYGRITLILESANIGFCRANNIGVQRLIDSYDYILFLNPDAFLQSSDFIDKALRYMEQPQNSRVGALTGKLVGFDISAGKPTGLIDSTGIFRTWYGRWYDRGQGQRLSSAFDEGPTEVPAICGALMFCRSKALREILLGEGEIFDENFFMYKEDIDLSLRLRGAGWTIIYSSSLVACHCRGWSRDRARMSNEARLRSARNDLRLCVRTRSPYVLYALAKYAFVRWFER